MITPGARRLLGGDEFGICILIQLNGVIELAKATLHATLLLGAVLAQQRLHPLPFKGDRPGLLVDPDLHVQVRQVSYTQTCPRSSGIARSHDCNHS